MFSVTFPDTGAGAGGGGVRVLAATRNPGDRCTAFGFNLTVLRLDLKLYIGDMTRRFNTGTRQRVDSHASIIKN